MALNGQALNKLGRHYDKLLAVVVLLALLGSLIYLSVTGVRRRRIERDYLTELRGLVPAHPVASELDTAPFEEMSAQARQPYQMTVLSNQVATFFIPESRVWCIDCRRPIPFDSEKCVFCGATQPDGRPPADLDSNRDGIPDAWYRQYGMDPYDSTIADQDWDGDGFTNRQEYEAGTSPIDPEDHPPVDVLLRVKSIEGRSVTLQFRGHQVMPDGSVRCQFNLPGGQTPMLPIGASLEIGGYTFEFVEYEVRQVERQRPGWPAPRLTDVPFAILQSGDQRIELESRVDQDFTEFIVTLTLPLDDSIYTVRPGHTFTLRGVTYRLISVDRQRQSVVILSESDDRELTVPSL